MARAVLRRPCGKRSAIIEWDEGLAPASPMETPIRASSSWTKDWAKPQTAVITLQAARQATMMLRREALSASRAIGRPKLA